MAKKFGRQNLNRWLDKTVNELHDSGILYSCILHTIILLVMSLTFLVPEPLQTIRLTLSFNGDSSIEEGSEPILDIQTMEDISESASDIESDFNPENIAAIESSDIIETDSLSPILDSLEPSDSNEIIDLATEQLDQQIAAQEETPAPAPPKVVVAKTGKQTSSNTSTNEKSGGEQLSSGDQAIVGAIGERLRMAGAKTGDIQISIGWNTVDDIDLHVKAKNGHGVSWINWMAPFGTDGGHLDVDMNASPTQLTNRAVENVYWPFGQSPQAEYIVGVHLFRNRTGLRSVPVSVVIKVGDKTKVFNVNCMSGTNVTEVTRFTKVN
jgi:hypothetical protein